MRSCQLGVAAVAAVLSLAPASELHAQQASAASRTDAELRSAVRFLADDALQGRRAGSAGADLAALYLSTQFEAVGLEPGGADGSFELSVALNAVRSEITIVLGGQGQTVTVPSDDPDVLGWPTAGEPSLAVDGELLFAGFGIRAPEFGWDDYGDTPVAGRILVMLPGDPGLADTTLFNGVRGTAYGSVDRKLREAARRGARGVIFAHQRDLVGLPWDLTRAEWGGEVLLDPEDRAGDRPPFVAWMSGERIADLLASFQRDWSVLRARAGRAGFRPIPLGVHAVVRTRSTVRPATGIAVIGRVPGGDAVLSGETVVVTANYDHLGTVPGFGTDSVFNGARDNAAGVAVLVGAARLIASDQRPPRRSVLFAAVSASEGVGSGRRLLAAQVPVPAERIAAVINLERPVLSGTPPAMSATDAAETGLIAALEAAARQEGVEIRPWQGFDPLWDEHVHLAFAQLGIPAITLSGGAGLDEGEAEYFSGRFRQPDDAFESAASFDALGYQARMVARLVRMIANADDTAAWEPGSPFREAWERLQRRRGVRP